MRTLKIFTLSCLFFAFSLSAGSGKQTALVAGGAGFLGSHLCDRLLSEGYDVICVDNLLTGSMSNIQHLKRNPHFIFIEQDVTLPIQINLPIEEVYNLACAASPPKYQNDPIHTLKTNFLGTLNLLELAKEKGAVFFQASTSEIYGDPEVHPQPEDYRGNVSTTGIRACYDEGKRIAETLCFEYYRMHDVSIKVARIFNTYGPRMALDDGRVVSNFVTQALDGTPITIYGNGSQTRSFCYVDDLIEGFRLLVTSPKECTGPINLGNPSELTVNEFAQYVTKYTGSASEIEYLELPKDDPTRRKPDISLAGKLLDWQPKVSLEEGLKKTTEYFLHKK